ncbi:hypothetical protein F8388_018443 [Cannabis sativa]|uniref:Uncharacterized protein n=1 Tax=Cannabis sativa TaxID=3483 RepID=A0A7J6F221_CANSA|nr:hypothetical protein F8388_018443 [Cannabis sativa]
MGIKFLDLIVLLRCYLKIKDALSFNCSRGCLVLEMNDLGFVDNNSVNDQCLWSEDLVQTHAKTKPTIYNFIEISNSAATNMRLKHLLKRPKPSSKTIIIWNP